MKDITIDGLLVIGLIALLFILVLELSILFNWSPFTIIMINSMILSCIFSYFMISPNDTGPKY